MLKRNERINPNTIQKFVQFRDHNKTNKKRTYIFDTDTNITNFFVIKTNSKFKPVIH